MPRRRLHNRRRLRTIEAKWRAHCASRKARGIDPLTFKAFLERETQRGSEIIREVTLEGDDGARSILEHPAHVKPLHDGTRKMGRRWAADHAAPQGASHVGR